MKSPPSAKASRTPFERFDAALRRIVSVSKEELLKREAAYKRARARKRKKKATR